MMNRSFPCQKKKKKRRIGEFQAERTACTRAWRLKSVIHLLNDKWWQESEGEWISRGADEKHPRVNVQGPSNKTKKSGDILQAGYGKPWIIYKPRLMAEVGTQLHEKLSVFQKEYSGSTIESGFGVEEIGRETIQETVAVKGMVKESPVLGQCQCEYRENDGSQRHFEVRIGRTGC